MSIVSTNVTFRSQLATISDQSMASRFNIFFKQTTIYFLDYLIEVFQYIIVSHLLICILVVICIFLFSLVIRE